MNHPAGWVRDPLPGQREEEGVEQAERTAVQNAEALCDQTPESSITSFRYLSPIAAPDTSVLAESLTQTLVKKIDKIEGSRS